MYSIYADFVVCSADRVLLGSFTHINLLIDYRILLFLLCSRPSARLTMRLHEMSPLLSVSYQFHGCFNVCVLLLLLQIFFHIVNPRFPLSSSAPHAFDVAVECLVWKSTIFHPFHVTEPCKSSFLDFVDDYRFARRICS